MTRYYGDWIQVFSGGRMYPLDPRPEHIFFEDIAHSLSMLCRYNGHCSKFYSVAEHCWLLSFAVNPEFALEALLHDASEAYTSDLPRPLKHSPEMEEFVRVENKIGEVIFNKFGLVFPEPAIVKEMDNRIIANERKALFSNPEYWQLDLLPIPNCKVRGYSPKTAKKKFTERYLQLVSERK